MIQFTPQWLDLREPADREARSIGLSEHLSRVCGGRDKVAVLDLGCGTGASLRHLASGLGRRQEWLLVDRSSRLLEACEARLAAWAAENGMRAETSGEVQRFVAEDREITVRKRCLDLSHGLDDLDDAAPDLISVAALLDLVSGRWLEALLAYAQRKRASVFAPLIYDGHVALTPAEPFDAELIALVNRHQRSDKGFGAALGPDAAGAASLAFRTARYDVLSETSPWHLAADQRALQQILIEDWRQAARTMAPDRTRDIDAWAEKRCALLDSGETRIEVGHRDFLALYPG